jgi:hypothetical protein
MIYSIQPIFCINLAYNLVFSVVDHACRSSKDDLVSSAGDFSYGDKGQSHVWAVENVTQEDSGHGRAIWNFDL